MICSDYATCKLSYESTDYLIRQDWHLSWQHKVAGFTVLVSSGKMLHLELAGNILTFVSLGCYDLANTWHRRGYGHQFLAELSFSKELPQPITLCYSWRAGKLLVLWHCRHSQ
jgi:hypothetical protein